MGFGDIYFLDLSYGGIYNLRCCLVELDLYYLLADKQNKNFEHIEYVDSI